MGSIYSTDHFLVSVALGVGFAAIAGLDGASALLFVVYGSLLGVLVDLDHFVIARLRTGNWDALAFCLRHPYAGLLEQDRVFDPGEVGSLPRLASHLALTGLVWVAATLVSPLLGWFSVLVLGAHVVGDVATDLRSGDLVAPGS